MLKSPRRLLTAIALLTAIGCGDDDGSGPTGTITVSASPTALSVQQGGTGTVIVSLVRGGGFDEAVNVSVSGLPSGVTASVSPTQLTGNTTQATVTVNVASTVAAGSYPATITASAAGVGSATATYTLTVTAAPAQDFTLSANPATVSIAPGGSGTATISIARTDFTGDVALTLVNPPTGITGTFDPATASANSSELTIDVAGTVAAGNQTLTVQGVGGGLTRTTTVGVTISAGATVTLALNPTTLSIAQGSSKTTALTATRTNYTGDVTPEVTGNPAGMTVTFDPTPLTGNTSTATVAVGAGVAPGDYALTITGNTGGAAGSPTATLDVTVTQATGGGNITWDFCSTDDLPLKFWKLDNGTWSEVTPTVVGNATRYSFSVADGQAGVAFTTSTSTGAAQRQVLDVTKKSGFRSLAKTTRFKTLRDGMRLRNQANVAQQTSSFFDTFVFYAMSNELGSVAGTCDTDPASDSKTFNVTGQAAGEEGLLGYGGSVVTLASATPSVNVNVAPGTYDWLAMWGPTPGLPDLTHDWNAYRIGRGEAVPGSAVAVDRTGASAFVSSPFTVTGGTGGSLWNFSQSLEGANGFITSFPIGSLLASSGAGDMLFLQPADRLATDLMTLNITNSELQGSNVDSRSIITYVGNAPPANSTYALPAAVPAFTVSPVNGAPVPQWMATGSIPAEFQAGTSVISVAFTGANLSSLYTISATRAWLEANSQTTTFTLSAPTLPGFLQEWAPAAPLDNSIVIMLNTNATGAPTVGTVTNLSSRVQSP